MDQDRFLALLEEHKRILYKVSNAYCRNPEDRQDLIQEIVIQLWQSFGRFDDRSRFSTWMYRVAMNVAISYYRYESRRRRDTVSIESPGLVVAITDPGLGEAGDELRILHQMIARLDELDRALMILYLDGYSHSEISDVIGITATNVATRINRIKQRLRTEYDASQERDTQEIPR